MKNHLSEMKSTMTHKKLGTIRMDRSISTLPNKEQIQQFGFVSPAKRLDRAKWIMYEKKSV